MDNKKEIVRSLEKMLDMLPENLTKEERQKADEIRNMLRKIRNQVDKENDNSVER